MHFKYLILLGFFVICTHKSPEIFKKMLMAKTMYYIVQILLAGNMSTK